MHVMSQPGRRYLLISPCRDEATYMRRTLDSVAAQTLPPALWVVVDDGSTDDTPAILAEYAAKLPYLKVVRRDNRGVRSVGPGVIEAFYAGVEHVERHEGGLGAFDYVCKLDLDLDIPHGYFETLVERMEAEPRLGTCSGKPYFPAPGSDPQRDANGHFPPQNLVSEACGDEMSVGMIKFYRTACFRQIGGFVREVMWDGIDCHRCRMLGWIACSWDDPALRFLHLRPMGTSHKGWLTGRMRHGFGQHFMGTGLGYMTASALFRMTRPPLVIGGAAMWWGYVRAMLAGNPRYDDADFRRFLNRYQWACLLRGKARATEDLNRRQASRWHHERDLAGFAPAAHAQGT